MVLKAFQPVIEEQEPTPQKEEPIIVKPKRKLVIRQ
jgi:hypothetical protein